MVDFENLSHCLDVGKEVGRWVDLKADVANLLLLFFLGELGRARRTESREISPSKRAECVEEPQKSVDCLFPSFGNGRVRVVGQAAKLFVDGQLHEGWEKRNLSGRQRDEEDEGEEPNEEDEDRDDEIKRVVVSSEVVEPAQVVDECQGAARDEDWIGELDVGKGAEQDKIGSVCDDAQEHEPEGKVFEDQNKKVKKEDDERGEACCLGRGNGVLLNEASQVVETGDKADKAEYSQKAERKEHH